MTRPINRVCGGCGVLFDGGVRDQVGEAQALPGVPGPMKRNGRTEAVSRRRQCTQPAPWAQNRILKQRVHCLQTRV